MENKKSQAKPPEDSGGTASACQKALAETCKALKAFSFYPENHPLREQLLHGAYQAISNLTKNGRVSLTVQRNGFSFADQHAALDNTPMTKALAQELFARELQRLSFLPELSLGELTEFLSLLTITPQKISAAGGVAQLLKKSGIRTIIVDEIDITAVFTRKNAGEAPDDAAASGADNWEDYETDTAPSQGSLSDQPSELSVEGLIARMSAETDDDKYRQLSRMLLAKGQPLRLAGDFDRLYTVLFAMVEQSADQAKSAASRDCAVAVLQQLCLGEVTEHLLNHLEEEDFGQKETIYQILRLLGTEAAPAVIKRLLAVGSKISRKSLTTAVIRIGAPAQAPLIALLKDPRWQVVHTAVTILGEMGNRDAVKGLALTVSHHDSRLRTATIRSLAKIGGMEATAVLTGLLRDKNPSLAMQAITWFGNTRNQAALQPLLQLIMKRDVLGKTQPLKREALAAIGRIGDRRALDPLFRLVRKKHWIVPGRWDELKLLAVEAIGNLGGEPARAFLAELSERGGRLGQAASAALETMAQRNSENNE
jgi:HEAT repeat protein